MIQVENLSKTYQGNNILDNLALTVQPGQTVAILGPSGSGKTTLLRLIAGLDQPDGGTIALAGQVVSSPTQTLAPHQRHIGFVFQTPILWPHMTISQNIAFGLGHLTAPVKKQRIQQLLERLAIAPLAHRYPYQLSGGEAKRASLARVLAPHPPYLLFDEPLTNLDLSLKQTLLHYIRDYLDLTAACAIYVTHDLTEAQYLSGQIFWLKGGKLQPDAIS
ncbi:ABC transporter (plasmid) [Picosynechococcus sp. PCC 7003]|uniref:ABC transporter ATP-binding protein n=1 Tax=Picosynechococcus sp. PCC 7003 TaxID=374981 RepID=UPI000810E3F6|nr:ABC transporter ATP-binding protein [Picosynechococcus sp. PCC 7003]ANV85908.1 ABC transporter [Picosynechococcus sp. PCC 7003]